MARDATARFDPGQRSDEGRQTAVPAYPAKEIGWRVFDAICGGPGMGTSQPGFVEILFNRAAKEGLKQGEALLGLR